MLAQAACCRRAANMAPRRMQCRPRPVVSFGKGLSLYIIPSLFAAPETRLQILQLIIFAGLAAVVLFQLYSVLGRRVGRQPEDGPGPKPLPGAPSAPDRPLDDALAGGVSLSGLAAVKGIDPGFDLAHFLDGARAAYTTIVRAYSSGDRETLKPLLSPIVNDAFEAGMTAREAEGRTEETEFAHPPRADLEKAELDGAIAQLTVRFLAEFRTRGKGPEGETVDDRRTAELWTFERNLKSKDPNWILIRVDAAEA